jgi:prepilin signal peptidase PulO-like enzyme (type II secretory pathway)
MILSQSHPLALLLDAIFIGAVVVLIVINLKHLILPNAITYPGCAVAIVARAFIPNLASFGFLTRAPFSKLPTFLVSIDGANHRTHCWWWNSAVSSMDLGEAQGHRGTWVW